MSLATLTARILLDPIIWVYLLILYYIGVPSVPDKPTWPVYGNEGNLFVINNEFKVIHNYKRDICQIWIDNMPQGFKYTGVDYFTEEPLLSKVLNEYLIDLVFLGWRKRRFAKEAGIVLLLISVVFWYNVVRCYCGRSKKNSKKILPPKKNTQVLTTGVKRRLIRL
jgi:hypothetical protein